MRFIDKKRAGVLAVIGTTLGAAALFVGLGAAEATTPCTDSPSKDTTTNVMGLVSVGTSTESTTSFTNVWVCATPPGTSTEANVTDPNSGTPGKVVYSRHCDSHVTSCVTPLNWTGAEVNPAVTPNAPGGSTAGSGAEAGTGPGTCVYANNSTPVACPAGFTIGGVTVNEADASVPTTHPNSGGCVTVGGSCVTTVPSGMGVRVLSGDSSNDTVTVKAAGGVVSESRDLGGCYGFNAGSGC